MCGKVSVRATASYILHGDECQSKPSLCWQGNPVRTGAKSKTRADRWGITTDWILFNESAQTILILDTALWSGPSLWAICCSLPLNLAYVIMWRYRNWWFISHMACWLWILYVAHKFHDSVVIVDQTLRASRSFLTCQQLELAALRDKLCLMYICGCKYQSRQDSYFIYLNLLDVQNHGVPLLGQDSMQYNYSKKLVVQYCSAHHPICTQKTWLASSAPRIILLANLLPSKARESHC